MTGLFQLFRFIHKQVGSKHHSVSDNIDFTTLENARGNASQHIFLPFELQSMSRIRASLKTSNDIIVRR